MGHYEPRRKGSWTKELHRRGKELNLADHPSERWLKGLWKKYKLNHQSDRWNAPVGYLIADLINRTYGYIVEVDGSSHYTLGALRRDSEKDRVLREKGFKVFRVRAFNMDSFYRTRAEIEAIHQRGPLNK